jgi:hypothetical protein
MDLAFTPQKSGTLKSIIPESIQNIAHRYAWWCARHSPDASVAPDSEIHGTKNTPNVLAL